MGLLASSQNILIPPVGARLLVFMVPGVVKLLVFKTTAEMKRWVGMEQAKMTSKLIILSEILLFFLSFLLQAFG